MIPLNLFDPYDGAVMLAQERERRARLGRWGRLHEDAVDVVKLLGLASFSAAVTILPWSVGVWTIIRWVIG